MDKLTLDLEIGEARDILANWETALQHMQAQANELDKKIQSTKNRIASLRAKLQGQELLAIPSDEVTQSGGSGIGSRRAPRGHNLAVIQTFLHGVFPDSRAAAEISHATQIGLSSVQAVLTRNSGLFELTGDKKWRLKTDSGKPHDNNETLEKSTPDGGNRQG